MRNFLSREMGGNMAKSSHNRCDLDDSYRGEIHLNMYSLR